LGKKWYHMSRKPPHPQLRACRIGAESRRSATLALTTRAPDAQPTEPSSRKVAARDAHEEMFSGSKARNVSSRNSQGSDRNKSIQAVAARSTQPPRYPAAMPTAAAMPMASSAVAGASKSDTRVP